MFNFSTGISSDAQTGLDLYEDLNTRIPRQECRSIFESIRDEAMDIDPKVWIEIMGSYRRGQESSGDVDILITRDTSDGINHAGILGKLIKALRNRGLITHDVSGVRKNELISSCPSQETGTRWKRNGWVSADSVATIYTGDLARIAQIQARNSLNRPRHIVHPS